MDAQTTDVPTRRRVWIIALLLLALIAVLVAACEAMSPDDPTTGESPGGGDGSVVIGDQATTFQIEGDATDMLTPGTESSLDLRLINTSSSDLAIVELTVEVRAIDAPNADTDHPCSAADFEVRQLSPVDVVRTLPAKSEHTLKALGLPVTALPAILMLNRAVNQNGCQQATLALTYTGLGTVVRP